MSRHLLIDLAHNLPNFQNQLGILVLWLMQLIPRLKQLLAELAYRVGNSVLDAANNDFGALLVIFKLSLQILSLPLK